MKDTKFLKDAESFDVTEHYQHKVDRSETSITSQLAEIKNLVINLTDTEPLDDADLNQLHTIRALLNSVIWNLSSGEPVPLPHQREEGQSALPSSGVTVDTSGIIVNQKSVPPGNRYIKCPHCHKTFVDPKT